MTVGKHDFKHVADCLPPLSLPRANQPRHRILTLTIFPSLVKFPHLSNRMQRIAFMYVLVLILSFNPIQIPISPTVYTLYLFVLATLTRNDSSPLPALIPNAPSSRILMSTVDASYLPLFSHWSIILYPLIIIYYSILE